MRILCMQIFQIEEAQAHLAELIEGLASGQEVTIAKGDRPIAKLVAAEKPLQEPTFGSARGKIIFKEGWNDPCPGFEEFE
jgi:antitoxin (DNA-binding transcriptional repressor) of toxin-antitoxin stability system